MDFGLVPTATHIAALLAALVFGALIGVERELRRHPAGMHTNALVSLGAALYVLAATLVGDPTGPARVAGQVITGVGFLCAGVILHEGGSVRGINTAVTVWCASAVGVLAGLGLVLWAALATLLVLAANVLLHICAHALSARQRPDER
ncbi:MAG TPA: MgtC/SapB family protein [Burkholderiales bacterium]|nr:MgtC/SapB family protein [Burkholderiales bacterium]